MNNSNRPFWNRLSTATLSAAAFVATANAVALPQGGQVVHGDVTLTRDGSNLHIQQGSHTAIVNWEKFNIGVGEALNVMQPGAQSAFLSRVIGADPSKLLGNLNANGRFYLINPNGIVVGSGANINVGEFIASTLDVADEDFINGGSLLFEGDNSSHVVNLGKIEASNGDVILLTHHVVNEGELTANNGTVALGAGDRIRLTPAGDQRIAVETSVRRGIDTGIDNQGVINAVQAELDAAGGDVYSLAINQSGIVRATGVENRNGRIMLTSDQSSIAVDGNLAAHNADGQGGEIFVGGGDAGNNPDIANASEVTVSADSDIDIASRSANGDGGHAVFWADERMEFRGHIDGQGGSQSGDGGYAEVSSPENITYSGLADLRAANGETGTLLIDPDAATVSTDADSANNFNNDTVSANLELNNFTIDTSRQDGDISVNAAVSWNAANRLTLLSGDSININANVTAPSGSLDLASGVAVIFAPDIFNPGTPTPPPAAGLITSAVNSNINVDNLLLRQNPTRNNSGSNAVFRAPGGDINLDGTVTANTLEIEVGEEGRGGVLDEDSFEVSNTGTAIGINNAANQVGTVTVTRVSGGQQGGPAGDIFGDVRIVNGASTLNVAGDFSAINGAVELVSGGDLVLGAGAMISTDPDNSDVVLASTGGSVINNAGAGGISTNGANSDVLIYSDNPTDTNLGGLILDPRYNTAYNPADPFNPGVAGSRALYTLAATLSFTADDLMRTYGAANPALTFTTSGLVGTDTLADAVSGTPALTTAALQSDDVGDFAINVANGSLSASDYNYSLAFAPGTLSIVPALLNIRANDASKRPNAPLPAFTATFNGLVNGDTQNDFAGLDFSTPAMTNSPPGMYAVTPFGAVNPNYDITFLDGVLTISDFDTLNIRADDLARIYGDANPPFTATITGFVDDDDEGDVTGLQFATDAVIGSNVGTFTITPFGASAPANYDIQFFDGTLTISARDLTITAQNATRTYGDGNAPFTADFDGLAEIDTAADISGLTLTSNGVQTSNVGNYDIVAADASNDNYNITLANGTLSITQRALTITAVPDAPTAVFGNAIPDVTLGFDNLASFDTAADIANLNVDSPEAFSDIGNYQYVLSGGVNPNYDITRVNGDLTITPRPANVVARDQTREYGLDNPSLQFAIENAVGSGNFPSLANGPRTQTVAQVGTDVGNYVIDFADPTAFIADNPNYSFTFETGILSITPAALTIDIANLQREYGLVNPAFNPTATGLRAGDAVSDVISNLQVSTTATQASDVGNYVLQTSGTPISNNYNVSFDTGMLQIIQATLSFLGIELAERIYGDANPEFQLSGIGFRNGDDESVINSVRFDTNAVATSDVGGYVTRILSATASNYSLPAFSNGLLQITPRSLNVAVGEGTREYGLANPDFGITFDNLASFDAPSAVGFNGQFEIPGASDINDIGLNVGSYGVAPILGNNDNYNVTITNGRLNITPAPIDVFVEDITQIYGRGRPSVDFAANGGQLRAGDAESSLNLSVDRLFGTNNVGTYVLPASINNPNYKIATQFGGQLEITPAPINLTIANGSRRYGNENPDLDFTITGLAFADQASDVFAIGYGDITSRTDIGTYNVQSELISENYFVNGVVNGGLFTILKRQLGVKPANVERLYGENTQGLDLLFNGDGLASFHSEEELFAGILLSNPDGREFTAAQLLADADGDQRQNTGVFLSSVLTQANPDLENYELSLQRGGFAILPRLLALKPSNDARVYGDATTTFDLLQAGEGLASFHELDDIVTVQNLEISRLDGGILFDRGGTNVGGTVAGVQPFSAEVGAAIAGFNAGDLRTRFNLSLGADASNYVIVNQEGALTITPREVIATVQDIVITDGDVVPPFVLEFDNLASFDTAASAFAGVEFDVSDVNLAASTSTTAAPGMLIIPEAVTDAAFLAGSFLPASRLDSYEIGDAFSDATFLAGNNPAQPVSPPAAMNPAEIAITRSEVVPIDFITIPEAPADGAAVVTIRGTFATSIGPNTITSASLPGTAFLTPEELEVPQPVTRFVRPSLPSNPNYAVTAVRNGRFTTVPDPTVVAAIEETNRINVEIFEFENFRGTNQFGFNSGEIDVLFEATRNAFLLAPSEEVRAAIEEAVCIVSPDECGSGSISGETLDRAIRYALATVDPESEFYGLVIESVADYGMDLLSSPQSELTAAQAAYSARIRQRMVVQRQAMALSLQVGLDARMEELAQEWKEGDLTVLAGRDIGYAGIIKDAAEVELTRVAESIAGGVALGVGATAVGVTAVLGTKFITPLRKAIFPFARAAKKAGDAVAVAASGADKAATGVVKTGGKLVAKAGSKAFSAAIVPASIALAVVAVAGVVVGAIARPLQIANDARKEELFNELVSGGGTFADIGDPSASLDFGKEKTNQAEQIMLRSLYMMAMMNSSVNEGSSGEIVVRGAL